MTARDRGRFRNFEHAAWEDTEVCSTYHERLGGVVAQVVGPMLDAVRVGAGDSVRVRMRPPRLRRRILVTVAGSAWAALA